MISVKQTLLTLIINLKTIKILMKITNLMKESQKINLIKTQTQNQRVLIINLMTFQTIQNRLKSQRTRSKIENLTALSAKSQNIERINARII